MKWYFFINFAHNMIFIMRTFFILACCFLFINPIFSQDDFSLLHSKGKIPKEFITLSKEKYLRDKATIGYDEKHNVRQSKEEFYLFTNYKVDYLLRSGKVLFGDDITKYVNAVGQYILKDDTALKDKIRFYVTKSPEVNAFSTYQGIVFVNLGLIAQVENEAELAYVLAHEIIHYRNHHVINNFLNTKDIIKGKGKYDKYSYNQKVHAYFNYSKENEMEADEQGLKDYYLKTGYDINQVINIFDVLLYSYLPFDEIPFDTTFFNDKYFKIPSSFYLKETKPISAVEDYDDSESTHPNIKSRRSKIYDVIGSLDNIKEGGSKYIISEKKFKAVQKEARFEMSQLYISNLEYGKSFYNTYLLLRKYPNSIYLKKKMGYVLYGLSKFANYHYLKDVLKSENKIEGESQQVYHILYKLKDSELTAIAIKYLWQNYTETKNEYFKDLATELMSDLFKFSSKTPGYFLKDNAKNEEDTTVLKELSQEEYLKLSKYQKIKYDKRKLLHVKNPGNINFLKLVFVSQFKDKSFETAINNAYTNANKEKDESKDKKKKKKGIRLGIDSITIVSPDYLVVNNNSTDFMTTEDHNLIFDDLLRMNAKKIGINTNLLTATEFSENDIDKFNDLCTLNSWLYEFLNDQNYYKLWDIQNSQQEYVLPLLKKYNMKYFAITGVRKEISSRSKSQIMGAIYMCFLVVPIPYSLYIFATKEKWTSYFFYLFNLENGKIVYANSKVLRSSDYQYVLNSNIYDTYNQLHKKPKR